MPVREEIDAACLASGRSVYAAESVLDPLRQCKLGVVLDVSTRMFSTDEKRLRILLGSRGPEGRDRLLRAVAGSRRLAAMRLPR